MSPDNAREVGTFVPLPETVVPLIMAIALALKANHNHCGWLCLQSNPSLPLPARSAPLSHRRLAGRGSGVQVYV